MACGGGWSPHCVLFILEAFLSICSLMLKGQTWELGHSGQLEPAFGSPAPGLSLAERRVSGRGVSSPRCLAGRLGIWVTSAPAPRSAFRQHVFPWDFLMHECLWEHLHLGTLSCLHLWLFMKAQNCSEDREPQRCQDTLGELVSSLLAVASASFQRVPRGT